MDILIASSFHPFKGGISKYITATFREMAKKREIGVICNMPNGSNEEFIDDEFVFVSRSLFPVTKGGLYRFPFYWNILRLILVKGWKIDCLYADNIFPTGVFGLVFKCFFPKKKLVIFTYGSEIIKTKNKWYSKFRQKVLSSADLIATISMFTANEVGKISNQKVLLLPPAYEGVFFEKSSNKNAFMLLTVSQLTRRKGHEYVLRALNELKGKLDFEYVIAGRGPYKSEIERMIKLLGLEKKVTLMGGVSDEQLEKLYQEASVFIMPTFRVADDIEGFGIVYLEAGAHSLPVIATKSGGASDVVCEGENAIVVREKNIEDIKLAILRLYSDKEIGNKLGEGGRKIAVKFSYEKNAQKILNFISADKRD